MCAREIPPPADRASSIEPPDTTVSGVWLTAGPVHEPITGLLLELLVPNQPNPGLREALVEELGRPVKKLDVALDYLGLRLAGPGMEEAVPLLLGGTEGGAGPVARGARHPGGRLSARPGTGDARPGSRDPRPRGLRPPGRGRAAPRPALRGPGPRRPYPRGDHRAARARDRGLRRGAGTGAPACAGPGSLRTVERRRHGPRAVRQSGADHAQSSARRRRGGAPVRAAGHVRRGPHELR